MGFGPWHPVPCWKNCWLKRHYRELRRVSFGRQRDKPEDSKMADFRLWFGIRLINFVAFNRILFIPKHFRCHWHLNNSNRIMDVGGHQRRYARSPARYYIICSYNRDQFCVCEYGTIECFLGVFHINVFIIIRFTACNDEESSQSADVPSATFNPVTFRHCNFHCAENYTCVWNFRNIIDPLLY